MGAKKIGRICILIITFGLTLASIIMLGVFANLRCSMESSDGQQVSCPEDQEDLSENIYYSKVEATIDDVTTTKNVYYPWHDRNVALGEAALTISFIFLTLVSLRSRFKSSKIAFARVCIGSLGFILLLVATKWMFVDLYDLELPDTVTRQAGVLTITVTYNRSAYLANAILVSLTCIFGLGITAWEMQKYIKLVHKQEKGQTNNEVQQRISPSSTKIQKMILITSLIITFLLALAAIILFGVLTKSKCSLERANGNSEECSVDDYADGCRFGIFYLSYNLSESVTVDVLCGWHSRDVGLGEAALGVSLLFVTLMSFRGFLSSSKLSLLRIYIGVISVILLVSAIILVSADFSGKMAPQPDLPKSLPDDDGFVDKGNRFRANIILVVLTCAFVSGLTAWDLKLYLKTGLNYDQNRTVQKGKPKSSKAALFMALAISFGLALASFIMFGILSKDQCSVNFGDTTTSCNSEDYGIYCENVYSVKIEDNTAGGDPAYVTVDCPWNDRDIGLGEAALGISLFFMIFVALRNSIKSLSLAITRVCAGLFSSLLLIAAVILMFIDLFDGEDILEFESNTTSATFTGTSSKNAYVANGVLVILTCVFVVGLSIREITIFAKQVRNNSQGYKKAPQANTPQSIEMKQTA